MRSTNILTIAGAAVAAAGALNGPSVSPDVSRHLNTILTYSPRHIAPKTSVSVADPVAAHGCVDSGTCSDAPSIAEVKAAPLESTTHCICFSDTNTFTARADNDTSDSPPEVTGGAIPQQMQASMAGLLGFFIMCLVML